MKKEYGVWYPVEKEGSLCADGQPYFGAYRLGSENNLIVHLDGGGASWNEFSAGFPNLLYNAYVKPIDCLNGRKGMYSLEDKNPFAKWNIINICYANGDFHIGEGDFAYTDQSGEPQILHHHGYKNFKMVMEQTKDLVPNPEKLLIFGESAGGFAAAALADAIVEYFPTCKDVTCIVDGAMIIAEMHDVIKDIWKAEERFYAPVHSDNVTADWLAGHYKKYGDQMKYLFISSTRDTVLSLFQDAYDLKVIQNTVEAGERYQRDMKAMCERLQKEVPSIGICIYDFPARNGTDVMGLTQHTILLEES